MRAILVAFFVTWTLGLVSASVHADGIDDRLQKMSDKFDELRIDGKLDEAEKVAQKMIDLAKLYEDKSPNAITFGMTNLAASKLDAGKFDESEKLYKDVIEIRQKKLDAKDPEIALAQSALGWFYYYKGDYDAAAKQHRVAIKSMEEVPDVESLDIHYLKLGLADALVALKEYNDAEKIFRDALVNFEQEFGDDAPELLEVLSSYAELYNAKEEFDEAFKLVERALKITQAEYGEDDLACAAMLLSIAELRVKRYEYADAMASAGLALKIYEKAGKGDSLEAVDAYDLIATCLESVGKEEEVAERLEKAWAIVEKSHSDNHAAASYTLDRLANVEYLLGKLTLAEKHSAQSIEESLKVEPVDEQTLAELRLTHGEILVAQLQLMKAETEFLQCEAAMRKLAITDAVNYYYVWNDLATLYAIQHRTAESIAAFEQAIVALKESSGEAGDMESLLQTYATTMAALGENSKAIELYDKRIAGHAQSVFPTPLVELRRWKSDALLSDGRLDEALKSNRLAIKSFQEPDKDQLERLGATGLDPHLLANAELALADIQSRLGQDKESRELFEKVRKSSETLYKPGSLEVATLDVLEAAAHLRKDRFDLAMQSIDAALNAKDAMRRDPWSLANSHLLKAEVLARSKQNDKAKNEIDKALAIAESSHEWLAISDYQARSRLSDASDPFEKGVQLSVLLDDPKLALAAIERRKNVRIVNQYERNADRGGNGLATPLPPAEQTTVKDAIENRFAEMAQLENQLTILGLRFDLSADEIAQRTNDAENNAGAARPDFDKYIAASRERCLEKSGLGVGKDIDIAKIQASLGEQGLMLAYAFGKSGGYVVWVDAENIKAEAIMLDEEAGKRLNLSAGPLTRDRLAASLSNVGQSGVLDRLSVAESADKAAPALAALYKTLIPAAARERIASGKITRLKIVTDGPLSSLPFDALVVEEGESPKYLLDIGPAVSYLIAPSGNIDRQSSTVTSPRSDERALIVSDVECLLLKTNLFNAKKLKQETEQGILPGGSPWITTSALQFEKYDVPSAASSVSAIASALDTATVSATSLSKNSATETAVRGALQGMKFVFVDAPIFCDGLQGGSFAGIGLAGAKGSPLADDGILVVEELDSLPLANCELVALLRAPQSASTNAGDSFERISLALLASGARQVVTTAWTSSDNASATFWKSLASGVFADVSEREIDYSMAIRRAKLALRNDSATKSPFFWGFPILFEAE